MEPWKDPPFLRTVNHLFLWAIYTMANWTCFGKWHFSNHLNHQFLWAIYTINSKSFWTSPEGYQPQISKTGCGFFQVQHLIGRPPNESAPAWQEMQQEMGGWVVSRRTGYGSIPINTIFR